MFFMKVLQHYVRKKGMHGRYGTKLLMKVKHTEFAHQSLIGLHAHRCTQPMIARTPAFCLFVSNLYEDAIG
jgi:hypothetical protein